MKFRATASLTLAFIVAMHAAVCGAEIDLKSLQQPLEKEKKTSKYGPYVGIFGGQTTGQDAKLRLRAAGSDLKYDMLDRDGGFLFGLEVGYAWRTRYYLEFALEFEALYSDTELNALLSPSGNAKAPLSNADLATVKADMSYAAFLLNGTVTLDLRRLRPYIGTFLTRFRPYVGAGFGGAQLWYRNQQYQSIGDLSGTATAPQVSPFGIDEFVGAYQVFGGLEFAITDKLGAYAEYRRLSFAKTNDLSSFSTDILLGGFHWRY